MASLIASQHSYNPDSFAQNRYATRPQLYRAEPWSIPGQSDGFHANAPMLQRIDVGADSSDDEVPQPMKFSALTKALLENDGSVVEHSPSARASPDQRIRSASQPRPDTPSRGTYLRISRKPSPSSHSHSQPHENLSPRVVRLATSQGSGGLQRAVSTSAARPNRQNSRSREGTPHELVTPGQTYRQVRDVRSRAGSTTSHGASTSRPGSSAGQTSADSAEDPRSDAGKQDAQTKYASSTAGRSKPPSGEYAAAPGSMRVKRPIVASGSFLKGAPVRRGFRRRESDDNHSPNDDHVSNSAAGTPQEDIARPKSRNESEQAASRQAPISVHDFAQPQARPQENDFKLPDQPLQRQPPLEQPRPTVNEPRYAIPPPRHVPHEDKENEPPPTFKRNKDQEFKMLGKSEKIAVHSDSEKPRLVADTPVPVSKISKASSPRRGALAPLNQNTPHRAAPMPPPKMTVLDTATTQAGASAVKSKKKRSHVLVNGKAFTLMGKIGKGGSSDVYRVMAENQRMFALKKVKLEDCDELAIRGYRGEIELLQRLKDVDRVVRLYDWEHDQDRQSLSVLMEMGEVDLNRLITSRLNTAQINNIASGMKDSMRESEYSNPSLDLAFTRFYWQEMLHCLGAVHAHDIVHSDLKPANFLVVQGRLKLIDFGIANRIETDVTMNVHRESHVGTPNYMSPESIIDTNASVPGQIAARGGTGIVNKMMKIGKPSDIWSLGCILYQMSYGRPPFAHIPNQLHRIMAITNPNVEISFPEQGVGGSWIPQALRSTLKKCLNRDPSKRPSVADLLSHRDPFLHPEGYVDIDDHDHIIRKNESLPINQEILLQMIQRVVDRCRDRSKGSPTDDEVRTWPPSLLAKVAEILEKQ
ncbi:MAG: Dual-specificity kinase, spindle pole body (SPB) duplication and spindle checkpoint function [Bogoriella megaspora]|nr:MAG: Dual-specificity kinase, spindle pole body (SPB) duplication and spindle checkpoint function [Bogoriella megaspora]